MQPVPSPALPPLERLLELMAALRAPGGCPWDREQDHRSLRWHAVEEVYELLDAIESGDDAELSEELGDLLLQVVFHAQLARERRAFDFDAVCRTLVEKLIRRHPHVFGDSAARSTEQVWTQWETIKRAEKAGSRHERASALDGIPRRLPALMRAQKLLKKAERAGLRTPSTARPPKSSRAQIAAALFQLAATCQDRGWSAEELLRTETRRHERQLRQAERRTAARPASKTRPASRSRMASSPAAKPLRSR
ncbi:MAG: MazG family protein [Verrucomicrobia bacterium]|nr:MazG family protein [Verrucomicrobiota bacterium]